MTSDLGELKSKILELLKSDEEFRYMIAGFIGLDRILDELRRLREDFNKLYRKSLEHDRRFEEINKRFEEINKRFEEVNRRFETIEKKLLEHDKRFEVIEKTLLEHGKRLSRIELELGALNESFYCKALWDDLREEILSRGEKTVLRKRDARIDDVDIDLLVVTDKHVYVVEAKVKPRHEDVGALLAKTDIARKYFGDKEVVSILVGALIGREVEEYAVSKGIKVYTY